MEKLSDLSKLTVTKKIAVNSVADTELGVRETYRCPVNANNAVEAGKSDISFTILPCLPAELDLDDCYLNVTFKPCKDGNAPASTDQISCVNFAGILFFEYMRVHIGETTIEM